MKTFKEQKWIILVYGVILFTIGVVQFILSIVDFKSAMDLMSYVVAIGLLIIGLMHILAAFIANTKAFFKVSFVLGSIAVACGVVFIIMPHILGQFIVYFVPVLLLTIGSIFLAKAIVAIVFKYKVGWIIVYFLGATVGITLGILALTNLNSSPAVSQVIYCLIGLTIAAIGVVLFAFGIRTLTKKVDNKEETDKK